MAVGAYRELVAWQRSMELVEMVYRISARFPVAERFGLTQQLRRAAVSVPSNLAEGHVRRSKREYLRLADIALGSLAETETQLLIAARLQFAPTSDLDRALQLVEATGRPLRGLLRSLARLSDDHAGA